VDGGEIRQGSIEFPRTERVPDLLRQAGAFEAVQGPLPVAWAVEADATPHDRGCDAAPSLSWWSVARNGEAPCLATRFATPLGEQAVGLVADAALRALAGLLAGCADSTADIDVLDPAQRRRQLLEWKDRKSVV